jgi:hypothetical protein
MEKSVDKILDKLSSYNIFNYLFPGVVFCVIADSYLAIPLLQDSIINGLILYYFIGLVISRFGSIVIEPILKKTGIIKFADYQSYIKAAKEDPKIELLSASNNTYRTLLSALLILCVSAIGVKLVQTYPGLLGFVKYSILPGLVLSFGFSYMKQTEYIKRRISSAKNSSSQDGTK